MDIKVTLQLLPLRDIVVFPHMIVPLFVGREKSVKAIEEVMKCDTSEKQVLLVTQKDAITDNPKESDLYKIGILVSNKNGLQSNYCSPIIELCTAKENHELKKKKKRVLRLDNYNFEDFTAQNFADKIEKGILTKTFGEPNFIIPFSDKYLPLYPLV